LGHDVLLFLVLMVAAFLTIFYLPVFLMKKAIANVREIFHRHGAIGIKNAKTVDELGLTPPDFWGRLMRLRDYKPHALQYLKQAGIVLMTEEGKLYMAEEQRDERLMGSHFAPMKKRFFSFRRPKSEK
jgi:hypothetical protein